METKGRRYARVGELATRALALFVACSFHRRPKNDTPTSREISSKNSIGMHESFQITFIITVSAERF